MAGARFHVGDECILDFGSSSCSRAIVIRQLRSGYVYVHLPDGNDISKVHGSRLSHIGKPHMNSAVREEWDNHLQRKGSLP
jgi:hypothetical protein